MLIMAVPEFACNEGMTGPRLDKEDKILLGHKWHHGHPLRLAGNCSSQLLAHRRFLLCPRQPHSHRETVPSRHFSSKASLNPAGYPVGKMTEFIFLCMGKTEGYLSRPRLLRYGKKRC